MNKNIFVALDFDNLDLALETTKKIRDEIAGVKVGTELYTICGNEGLKKLKELGVDIFLDLKLGPEIPNQVKKTVSALETLKTIKYLTIHTSGDYEMLNSAKEAAGSIELLGVTVLTSQSNLQNLGIKNSIKDQVKILVELANKSKLAGVISSAQDLSLVRSISNNLKIFQGVQIHAEVHLPSSSITIIIHHPLPSPTVANIRNHSENPLFGSP